MIQKHCLRLLLAVLVVLSVASCSDSEKDMPEKEPQRENQLSYEILKDFSFDDLKHLQDSFKSEYLGIIDKLDFLNLISIIGNKAQYDGKVQLHTYKIMFDGNNPKGDGSKINLSGVVIVPPHQNGRKYKYVVAPPYTYVLNKEAPTNRIKNNYYEPNLIFWLLLSYRNGYAVIMPDYPGFGDSYGQCYIPYVQKEPMTDAMISYLYSGKTVLKDLDYQQEGGLIISGYSLGAYISLQLARELETNDKYKDIAVDLLMTGGSPCNLLQEANLIRASEEMPQPYLFPLTILGYKKNSYRNLDLSKYLQEPYASSSEIWLDGQHEGFTEQFTKSTTGMFTTAFIKNEGMDDINKILDENSVKPWQNKCKMIMTHGKDDETVYYSQAEDFSNEQENAGGNLKFVKTNGTHTGAGIWFYLLLYDEIN